MLTLNQSSSLTPTNLVLPRFGGLQEQGLITAISSKLAHNDTPLQTNILAMLDNEDDSLHD